MTDPRPPGSIPQLNSAESTAPSGQREQAAQSTPQRQPVQGEDFYWEGPYMVFTEAWHRKRGYCCGSACRHCPWNHENVPRPAEES